MEKIETDDMRIIAFRVAEYLITEGYDRQIMISTTNHRMEILIEEIIKYTDMQITKSIINEQ